MPVSALVITLSPESDAREQAVATLRDDPRVEVGQAQKSQLPAVLTTDSIGEGIGMVKEHIPAIAGVEFVRVVRVDFADTDPAEESSGGWKQARDRLDAD